MVGEAVEDWVRALTEKALNSFLEKGQKGISNQIRG